MSLPGFTAEASVASADKLISHFASNGPVAEGLHSELMIYPQVLVCDPFPAFVSCDPFRHLLICFTNCQDCNNPFNPFEPCSPAAPRAEPCGSC